MELAQSPDAEIRARVTVQETASGIEGALVLERGGVTTTRSVAAATCDDVLEALTFTLLMALEEAPESPPAPAPPPPKEPPPPPAASPDAPPDRDRAASAPPSAPGGIAVELGVAAGITTLSAPTVAPGGEAWVGVASRARGVLAPSAALGLSLALPVQGGALGAEASFQGAVLDGCPLRFGDDGASFRPCLRAWAGRSQARSEGFAGARLEERAQGAAGASGRFEMRVAGPLRVHALLAAGVPFERTTYRIGQDAAFATPPLVFFAALGLGASFR